MDADKPRGAGNDGRARAPAPAPEPPVAVLPLATDDTDRTDRTEWIDAFDAVRSRCNAADTDPPRDVDTTDDVADPPKDVDTTDDVADPPKDVDTTDDVADPGIATDDGGLVLFPRCDACDARDGSAVSDVRDASDRSDDEDAVFGMPEDVRDCGRGMAPGVVAAAAAAEPATPRGKSAGNGGSALDTGLCPVPALGRRMIRGTGCGRPAVVSSSLSLVFPTIVGTLCLRRDNKPPAAAAGRRVSSGEELKDVGVGLRSSSRGSPRA